MRRNLVRKMTVAFVVFCAAVAMLAQDVQYNYHRDADFSVYKTYQWVKRSRMMGNELVDKDIRRAIDGQLRQKGLQRVANNRQHLRSRKEGADMARERDEEPGH